jgi:hypothetical protein
VRPTRTILFRLTLLCAIFSIAGSCSVYDNYQSNRPAKVLEIESRLVQAGFRRVPIETPEQDGAVAQLPMHRLNRYQSANGSVYWYADPTVCSCLYEGDQKAYELYAGLLQQEHDTAEYVNDVQPEQVTYLSPFGYAFPPPLFLGGWPVMIPRVRGPVPPFGGPPIPPGGGPIHPRSGGGGVTPRSGHGGGHGIGGHGHR